MNPVVTPEISEVLEAQHYRPAISIILPFDPKMTPKNQLGQSLKSAIHKVEQLLVDGYDDEIVMMIMYKLRLLVNGLNFNTHKKSVAMYVSPVFEKVLYLDIDVQEKIIVDESFEIRELLYNKKQDSNYLVLLLSGKRSHIYLGNKDGFNRIVSNSQESMDAYINDVPEKVANFSDGDDKKDIELQRFLEHIDRSLHLILKTHNFPLFVLGVESVLGHFKKITKHQPAIVDYVHGNYDEFTLAELKRVLAPHIQDWESVKQKDLINQLSEAANQKKLSIGMSEVWRESMGRKGRLLVVEKDYQFGARHGSNEEMINNAIEPYHQFSYIKDAVDDVIEKVLENGGDVEFVEADVLKEFQHIALVQYY